ncbi:MAG: T9SS type A sorting domain-containing protein [candidate division Zixibacteria bacterium]|nr:T9SS type A sorting domain-containing protein [candidate division Zixibacteria bacterium]
MAKKALLILICFAVTLSFANITKAGEIRKVPIEIADAMTTRSDAPVDLSNRLWIPYQRDDITDSPGIIVGLTYYDYQTNGSTGSRVIHHECGEHMCWMNRTSPNSDRLIYYNFIDDTGVPQFGETGTPISEGPRDGYTTMDVMHNGRAAITYHDAETQGEYRTLVAIDADCGLGIFTIEEAPHVFPGDSNYIWPYIAVDHRENIQITNNESISTGGVASGIAHTFKEEPFWSPLVKYSTEQTISPMVVASPVDDKVALVWNHVIAPEQNTQHNNDVVYIQSQDGVNWDYQNIINITNYQVDDTLRSYADVDAVYDFNGNLHIVWNAKGYWEESGTVTVDACFLYHWSEATGINMVYDAWHTSYPGTWNLSASKPSVAVDEDGNLFVLFTRFDEFDVSNSVFSNGELYLCYSTDGGITWADSNLTETNTEGCFAGDCESEHWSSMEEHVLDHTLRIMYIEDKDAGGGVLNDPEGAITENPVRYLEVQVPTSVKEDDNIPGVFTLNQNYPNPFNSSTEIVYSLERPLNVKLSVYNVLGELVGVIDEGRKTAGEHTVRWDAPDNSSGVYFYQLSAGGSSFTKRMVLMK